MKTSQEQSINTAAYDRDFKENLHEMRIFYWILVVTYIVISILTITGNPTLQTPMRLAIFISLMLVHIGLHLYVPYLLAYHQKWLPAYFIVQAGLAFTLTWLGPTPGLMGGLYLGLAGEAVGMLPNIVHSTIVVSSYLLLSGVNYAIIWGWSALGSWAVWVVPMAFFVIVYVAMFVRQARARSHAQELLRDLEIAHNQLSDYAARVEELTRSAERQRMARELHDTLAQGLAGLILQLEAADSHLQSGRAERAQVIVQQAMTRARGTLVDARQAIDDLRQREDAAPGLEEYIREEAARFTNTTGIPCRLDLSIPSRLNPDESELIRRTVAEGLINVARHAQASQVILGVRVADGRLILDLKDDGIGFQVAQAGQEAVPEDSTGHYGLLGMHERARLAGGELVVESSLGNGTRLELSLPLRLGDAS